MNEWMHEWTNKKQMNEKVRRKNGCYKEQTSWLSLGNKWMKKQMNEWMNEWMKEWINE